MSIVGTDIEVTGNTYRPYTVHIADVKDASANPSKLVVFEYPTEGMVINKLTRWSIDDEMIRFYIGYSNSLGENLVDCVEIPIDYKDMLQVSASLLDSGVMAPAIISGGIETPVVLPTPECFMYED